MFKKIKKYIYVLRLKELDRLSEFRFKQAFFVATYITMIAPILVKLEGLYFTVSLITIIMILKNISSKFLEPLSNKLILGTVWKLAIFAHFINLILLLLYFYDKKIMIYFYSFFAIIAELIFSLYGIKLNNQFVKKYPKKIKKLQIFRQNIWNEGFLLGLFLSLGLQQINLNLTIAVALTVHVYVLYYMISNWNFFDNYFKK
jgi:hypothetical protein